MGADGQVQFPIDQVHRHAGTVDQVADAMQTARSAVHEVTMDSQAYGQLCQFLPTLLSPIFDMGADTLSGSIEALRETAANLRSAATSTQTTDVRNAQTVGTAGNPPGTRLELPL